MSASKVTIVIGDAMAIGASVVRLLAAQGRRVAIGEIANKEGKASAVELNKDGAAALFVHADVSCTVAVTSSSKQCPTLVPSTCW